MRPTTWAPRSWPDTSNVFTICLTYFKSLTLANLRAALHSLRQQDLPYVREVVVVDNNTDDLAVHIQATVDALAFPVPVRVLSVKHEDASRTHSWSTNVAVRAAATPLVLFTRADYLLAFDTLHRVAALFNSHPEGWNGFVTGNGYHLDVPIETCEQLEWRRFGPSMLLTFPGSALIDYTVIDAGVWAARRDAFDRVGGLSESLTAWGHAQTHFQYKLFKAGTEFVRIPEALFFHPKHGGSRDMHLAHQQLTALGSNARELWDRYEGVKPY